MVTGGASGIGEAIAVLFAAQNADVVVADVDSAKGEDVVAGIRSAGGSARFVELNVADDDAVGAAVDRVVAESGALDVMVNNAGINGRTAVDQRGWWRLMGVNLLGVAWGTRHAVRVMRQAGGGVVLNTGSHAGQRGHRTHVYGASKAAVHTLTALHGAAARAGQGPRQRHCAGEHLHGYLRHGETARHRPLC